MIILDTISTVLRIKLSGAISTNQLPITSFYVDRTSTTFNPASANTATNNTTYVTFVGAPSASTQRQIKFFTIQNQDTAVATAIVEYYDGTNGRQLLKVTLSVGDTLQYADGEGFKVIDTNGNIKQSFSTTGFLQASNNLSDVSSVATSRTNLGLGDIATQGYTAPTDWSGVIGFTGFSVNPTVATATYGKIANLGWAYIILSATGTSNASTFTITGLPINSLYSTKLQCVIIDGGNTQTTSGLARLTASSGTITFGKNLSADGGFTTTLGKGMSQFFITFIV